jgi:hypothetical protein
LFEKLINLKFLFLLKKNFFDFFALRSQNACLFFCKKKASKKKAQKAAKNCVHQYVFFSLKNKKFEKLLLKKRKKFGTAPKSIL